MPAAPAYPLRVYFDGSCAVCSTEMAAYRRKTSADRLIFIDISAPEFDPAPLGIDLTAFMYELHAIDRDNRVYRGVDAFRAIWQAFPAATGYGLLGTLVALPGVHLLARCAYWSFARLRKFLPASHDACKDGVCWLGRDRPHQ
jgi:predicted DCC family thiol-disulfide oxidoreductase YuxK